MQRRPILLSLMVGALLLACVPAVSAHPIKPTRCEVGLVFTGTQWEGTIGGDECAVPGTVASLVDEAVFPGYTEHWVGRTYVYPATGGYIEITEKGVWNFGTFKYRTSGRVTDASAEYAAWVGASTHGMGYTSQFPPPPENPVVTAEQSLRFN